ncbi:MAG: hypothetical protein ACRD8W_19325, partial [Nitrososphaeraceae archaeon]
VLSNQVTIPISTKKIDIDDLLKEYMKRYHSKTSLSFVDYFRISSALIFGPSPDTELFKLTLRTPMLEAVSPLLFPLPMVSSATSFAGVVDYV